MVSTLLVTLAGSLALFFNGALGKPCGAVPTCTPISAGNPEVDDTPAIESAFQQCGNGGVIILPQDSTYSIRSHLDFTGCAGCEVRLDGRLVASDDFAFWNNTKYIMQIRNVRGVKLHSPLRTGVVDGNGQAPWDWFGTHENLRRPVLFAVENSTDVDVSGVWFRDAPNVFVNVGSKSERVSFSSVNVTAITKSQYRARHTDGFDIGESRFTTLSDIYVQNGDDCVAFKPGSDHVTVTNIICQGSHGLSVGSLGKSTKSNDVVQNIYVGNATMRGATKAAGIKIYPGGPLHGTATVRNVTWDGVVVEDCDAAFEFDACYNEDEKYCRENPSGAKVTEIYVRNWSGRTSTRYAPTTGYVLCPVDDHDACDVGFENWNVSSGVKPGVFKCGNITPAELGVDCLQV